MTTRKLLPAMLVAWSLLAQVAEAGMPRRNATRHGLHATFKATKQVGKTAQIATPARAGQGSAAGPNAPASGTSELPSMAPTMLKTQPLKNAVPPLPSPVPASVGNRVASTPPSPQAQVPSTAAQSQAARPDAVASSTRQQTSASTALPGGMPNSGNTPGSSPTVANALVPPKSANLPPGPLTSAPVGIVASPNEVRITGLGSSSAPWSIVLLLTALTLLPSLLICVTPFARLLIVFHFLRQALGLQTTPSNQTLIGLTLILTFFIMEPVGKQIYVDAILPLQNGAITPFESIARAKEPMRDFMVHFVREKDAALFLEIAKEPRPRNIRDLSMRVLLPAYIVSELKSGFQIGAVLFLPFLVVDMVVASITTSVGMMQLPPVVISTPLKLLLFLMVDGWHLLIGALVRSFN